MDAVNPMQCYHEDHELHETIGHCFLMDLNAFMILMG